MKSNATSPSATVAKTTAEVETHQLGRIPFTFIHCDDVWHGYVAQLLPAYNGPELLVDDVYTIQAGCNKRVRDLVKHMVRKHSGTLWIDATTLLSPNNTIVLLAGLQASGKSTLALALALKHNWKIIANESTLVDRKTGRLISFRAPFCLTRDGVDLIKQYTGTTPEPLIDPDWGNKKEVWTPLGQMAAALEEYDAHFGAAVFLSDLNESKSEEVPGQANVSSLEFLKSLLPVSGLILAPNAIDDFLPKLEHSKCVRLNETDFGARLEAVSKLVAERV